MTTKIQHPAYVLARGKPSRASVGTESYDIDAEGYLTVDDDARAVEVMERLAQTYGVTYTDDGEVETDTETPPTADSESEDADSASGEDTATDTTDTDADTETDDGEALAEAAADALDRRELEAMEMGDLKARFDDLGGDRDAVDMRQKDEVVAAVLRLQADSVSDASD